MKISYNWLKEYVDIDLPVEEMEKVLTFCGLEVEGMEKFESVKGGLEGILIGEVVECDKHPDADKLSVTKVDVGEEELLQIVCGAPNVAAGQKVPVATVGTTLYSGDESFVIKKAKLRGVLSQGMICAEDELGLGSSHDGILVLDNALKVGTKACEVFDIKEDWVFEIGLTPNRSDAASHIGVARDVVAVLNARAGERKYSLKFPEFEFSRDTQGLEIPVEVLDTEKCPRYSGLTLENLKVGESPDWLRQRLEAIDVRPINSVVDITNYVLHETGQPLHAFDAEKIKGGKVLVKTMPENTVFVSLDEVERKLSEEDLMICDAEAGMCIAGVFGGIGSGITEESSKVFLESAYFNPVSVRKTSKRHLLKTDASFRFERGADPEITLFAMKRAASLLKEICGAQVSSDIIDIYPQSVPKNEIELDFTRMTELIGKEIPEETVQMILEDLGIEVVEKADKWKLLSPTNKNDVTRQADIVEEVLRVYGYNSVEFPETFHSALVVSDDRQKEKAKERVADMLVSHRFFECWNNSIVNAAYMEQDDTMENDQIARLNNPLTSELNAMRQTLLYGMLENVAFNSNRKQKDLKLFEFGNIYFRNTEAKTDAVTDRYKQEMHLAMAVCGRKFMESWDASDNQVDFYFLKARVDNVFAMLAFDQKVELEKTQSALFSEGLKYSLNGKKLVEFGCLNPKVTDRFDIDMPVYFAEFNWDNMYKAYSKYTLKYQPVSRFPEVRRDLALLLHKEVEFGAIKKLAMKTESKLLQDVRLFDIYEGDKLPEGKKSYALSFTLLDAEKTLTDKQIDKVMKRLMFAFEREFSAELR